MSSDQRSATERVKQYFRGTRNELLALASKAVAEHSGLKGSHREQVCRSYLQLILPKRFEIGRGMVYGMIHRSREADIVLWDAQNYPHLEMSDHSFFFAESVRAVLEVKSNWNMEEFEDVRLKTRAVKKIMTMSGTNLTDTLAMMQMDIESLRSGDEHDGMILTRPRIGTAAIFLRGGSSFSLRGFQPNQIDDAEDDWPDVMVFLEAGIFVLQRYRTKKNGTLVGQIEQYQLGEDVLLAFTNSLLALLEARVVRQESEFYFDTYAGDVAEVEPVEVVDFAPMRPIPDRVPLWRGK